MRYGWCCYESRTDSTDRISGNNVFTSVVMPVICWYTGIQPPSFIFLIMHYKPYSQEWHRHRYLKEAIFKYLDDGIDNEVILEDILNIVSDRKEAAQAESLRLSDLETKLRE